MNLERKVRKCNALLRAELGEHGGVYAWHWSESPELIHRMRARHADGTPKMDYVADQNTGLIIAAPVYVDRKICILADRQWLICRLLPPEMEESEWLRVIGTAIPYPRNGTWAPCNQFMLDRGDEPTEELTWEVIGLIRAQRRAHQRSEDNELEYAMARAEEKKKEDIYFDIKDSAPAFNGIPGQKEHWSAGGIGPDRHIVLTNQESKCQ